MIAVFDNKPLPIHAPFHQSRAYERMNFGAFGSGKTYCTMDEVHAWCLEQPGIRGLVIRKTVPELRDTTEPIFRERMPAALWQAGKIGRTGGHLEHFEYPNGSVVLFRSMDDWNKHRSLNVGFIAYDECNEIDEESYLGMMSRVRQVELTAEALARGYTGKITRRGIWGSTNPAGKDWLWRRFHPASPHKASTAEAFMSTSLDNPFLPPEFLETILAYPKAWVKRFVLCQFDDFAGRIYDEWGENHLIAHPNWDSWEPTDLRGRVFWMGMDPGTESPTAGLWVWLDRENRRLVGVAEYEHANLSADVHTAAWRKLEAEQQMNVRWRVADPNAITQRDRGTVLSLQTQYSRLGYNFTLGASNEDARIMALGRLINLHRFVVTDNCPKTYEAIKQYQWKDLTPQQRAAGLDPVSKPLKKNTHLVECGQWLANRQSPLPVMPKKPETFSEDVHRIIRGQITRKAKQLRRGSGHDLGGLKV